MAIISSFFGENLGGYLIFDALFDEPKIIARRIQRHSFRYRKIFGNFLHHCVGHLNTTDCEKFQVHRLIFPKSSGHPSCEGENGQTAKIMLNQPAKIFNHFLNSLLKIE